MKILHFADLHIGVETHGRPDPADGLSTRLHDFLDVFDELVDAAIAERIDLVLFAGDAYKSRDPSQTHQREFARRIRRLSDAGIPVYLLVGNHDVPNARARASALEIFDTLAVPNVFIGDTLGTRVVTTSVGPIQIVGVPWPSVSQLLTRDEMRGLSITEIDRELERRVAEGIAREAERLDPAVPAVLTAHIAMADSIVKTASEQFMTLGRFPRLRQADLSPQCFDYVALGHHHCYQVLRQQPPVIYAGSLQRVDFGEETDPKGFVVVEIDQNRRPGERAPFERVAFREVRARRFQTVDVQPLADDPTDEVVHAIDAAHVTDAIVRLRLRLSPDQSTALDERRVREHLASAHAVAGIAREVARPARRRLPATTSPENLSPLEALEAYLDARDEPAERRSVLLEYARRVVDGGL
ncbi:MAG: exonuclease SbcCD subunit D [Dehalococcoidia bacterium]